MVVDLNHLTRVRENVHIDRAEWEALCKHCGKCCQRHGKACQYLEFKDGKSRCKIYPHRYGKICNDDNPDIYCTVNEAVLEDGREIAEGCPYNKFVGKQIFIRD